MLNPILWGFGYSRPHTTTKEQMRAQYDTGELKTVQHAMKLDIYHHPAKRKTITLKYGQAFDLYS